MIWILISLCTGGVKHLYYNNNCYAMQSKLRLRYTRQCGDIIQGRWASLHFSDVNFFWIL